MEIRLSPEVAAVIEQEVSAGRYDSADACVARALQLLRLRDELERERALLEQSLREIANGELMSEEDVRAELALLCAEQRSSQSAA